MKTAVITLLLLIVLSLPMVCAQDSPDTSFAMPYRPGQIVLDGRLDDWQGIAPMELRSAGLVRGGQWNGPDDLSAYIWLTWDEELLYFAADLRDSTYLGVPQGKQIWNADSLILILGLSGQIDGPLHYMMISSSAGEPQGVVLRGRGTSFNHKVCDSFLVRMSKRDEYAPIFEGAIAWADLLEEGAALPNQIDINVEVRDVDGSTGIKSILWLPTTTSATGQIDMGIGVLVRPKDFGGMLEPGNSIALRESVRLVEVPVVVVDRNNEYVRDLDEGDFVIRENGAEQALRELRYETRPITVGMLMDSSGSMEGYMEEVKEAAITFLDNLREEDRAFVIAFNHNIELLKDFDGGVEEAKEAIDQMRAQGGTMLHSALYFALQKLKFLREKKVLILFSDGLDESHGLPEIYPFDVNMALIREEAKRREVSVYAIAFRLAGNEALSQLQQLTRETGGRLFTPRNVDQLIETYGDIARELRSQYLLSYVSTNSAMDGLWRAIEVIVRDRDYAVRTRSGYYAPKR